MRSFDWLNLLFFVVDFWLDFFFEYVGQWNEQFVELSDIVERQTNGSDLLVLFREKSVIYPRLEENYFKP